jgi:hypothetical protein
MVKANIIRSARGPAGVVVEVVEDDTSGAGSEGVVVAVVVAV